MIFAVILWTLIGTAWIAGTVICGIFVMYHTTEFEKCSSSRFHGESEEEAGKRLSHLIKSAAYGTVAVALPVSAVVTFIVWLNL